MHTLLICIQTDSSLTNCECITKWSITDIDCAASNITLQSYLTLHSLNCLEMCHENNVCQQSFSLLTQYYNYCPLKTWYIISSHQRQCQPYIYPLDYLFIKPSLTQCQTDCNVQYDHLDVIFNYTICEKTEKTEKNILAPSQLLLSTYQYTHNININNIITWSTENKIGKEFKLNWKDKLKIAMNNIKSNFALNVDANISKQIGEDELFRNQKEIKRKFLQQLLIYHMRKESTIFANQGRNQMNKFKFL